MAVGEDAGCRGTFRRVLRGSKTARVLIVQRDEEGSLRHSTPFDAVLALEWEDTEDVLPHAFWEIIRDLPSPEPHPREP